MNVNLKLRAFPILIVLSLMSGCGPATEPVGSRPTQAEMLGNWTLVNSPKLSASPVPVPSKGTSSITLTSNQMAKLTNVLVQKFADFSKAPSGIISTLETRDTKWEVAESGGKWCVEIKVDNQVLALTILQKGEADLQLKYRPDPEEDAFIYVREAKAANK
jgi:hypothetical protein